MKSYHTSFSMQLSIGKDDDIIKWLDQNKPMAAAVKEAIREKIAKE